jgi:zinc/manganese transport system substrate-binding protein
MSFCRALLRLKETVLAVVALATCCVATIAPLQAQQRVNVVATFSILGDFTRNVGGERINLTTLVGSNGDTHVYTPTSDDAKHVAAAQLVVINGLGLEGWLPRLVHAAGGHARLTTASAGIVTRAASTTHEGAQSDPHAWQAVPNAKIYVANIRDALIEADPAGAEVYRANAAAYLARLDALDREVREAIGRIPENRRRVISSHDAFGYFAAAYGVDFIAPQGVSTEAEVGAGDLAGIIRQIRTEKIPAIFLENMNDPRLMGQIGAETGVRIGGTLYSDALTEEKGEAPTYIEMVRHNIRALTSALSG